MRIELLVEGPGDKSAIPSLLSRYFADKTPFIGHALIAGCATKLINRPDKCKNYIKSRLAYDPQVILYLSDCDGECPVELANTIYEIADEAFIEEQCFPRFAVCIFNPEYEVLFLVSADNIPNCEECPVPLDALETRRNSKGVFKRMIGGSYRETHQQKEYTKYIDFDKINEIDSGAHLLRVLEWIQHSNEQVYNQ